MITPSSLVFAFHVASCDLIKALKSKSSGGLSYMDSLFGPDDAPASPESSEISDDLGKPMSPLDLPAFARVAKIPGKPHAAKPVTAATLASLFDETLHPRAGSGNTVMNPETGQIITGGQFAPSFRSKTKPVKPKKEITDDGNILSGDGLSGQSENESARPLHHFAGKRNAQRANTQEADALRGESSLFDQGDWDAPVGGTGGGGAGLPTGAGHGASTGSTRDESANAVTQGTTDPVNPLGVLGAITTTDEERERLGIDADALTGAGSSVDDGVHNFDAPMKRGYDYRITDEDAVGKGSFRVKFNDNMEALRILKTLDAEGRDATPEEQARLVKYTGWGWGQALFKRENYYPYGPYHKEYSAMRDLLTDDEMTSARGSTLNAHYTSPNVIRAIWGAVERLGFTGGRVLEPASGIGHFFGLMPEAMAARSTLAAVELDPLTARICGHLYQSADMKQCGFEETSYAGNDEEKRKNVLPDGFYDLAISNVPFENYGVSDPQFDLTGKAFLTRQIHNYFFAQALNKVRAGGIVAFVTSTGTMDAPSSKRMREHLASHADLLGVIRLPSDAFEENAGTSVTTDVIFLRKRATGEMPNGENWTQTVPMTLSSGEECITNEYMARHAADALLGTPVLNEMYHAGNKDGDGETRMAVTGDGSPIDAAITKASAALLAENVYKERGSGTDATKPELQHEFVPPPAFVKIGGYGLVGGKLMRRKADGGMTPVQLPVATMERITGMLNVRDKLRILQKAMLDPAVSDNDLLPGHLALTSAYNSFKRKRGELHDSANIRAFAGDPDLSLLLSLEEYNPDTKSVDRLSDVFAKRTMRPVTMPTSAGTPQEALAHSLSWHGNLDFKYMSELTGVSPRKLQGQLLASGHVFRNPNGDFEERSCYLSGNVRAKLRQAQAAASSDPSYQPNVDALLESQPAELGPSDIDVHLGAGFVPPHMIQSFLCHILNIPLHDKSQIPSVDYIPTLGQWTIGKVGNAYKWSAAAKTTYGTSDVNAVELLHMALNGQRPTVYKNDESKDGKPIRTKDLKSTEAASDKLEAIHDAWAKWAFSDTDRTDMLCELYNETYNCDVDRKYDGSHLTLPGMSDACRARLNPHVKDAIWRQMQSPTTLLAHCVGAGKTWSIAGAAMEMRRTGAAIKPMMVVPNHLVAQGGKEILEVYPGAKILLTTKKDFAPARRREFLSRIQNGDWDMVIIGHSAFGKVPVSAKREAAYFKEQIATLRDYLSSSITSDKGEGDGKGKKSVTTKQLEKSIKSHQAKLQKAMARREKNSDNFLDFEDLGVDHMFVDESHTFKNLEAATKRQRVKGIPSGGAQRALDMLLKCNHMQEHTGGRGGLTFATGTPVSNSMAELYTTQRYLDGAELKKRGLGHLDAWIAQFGKTKVDLEATATGELKRTERMSRFVNLPELSHLFRRFADVLMPDQLKVERPDAERLTVACPMSPSQETFIKSLAERAKRLIGPASDRPDPSEDNMLKITSEGRKNSLDQRLVNGGLPDDPNSKINMLCVKLREEYEASHGIRGTQAVFMDMGTPKSTDSNEDDEDDEDDGDEDPSVMRDKRAMKLVNASKAGALRNYGQAAHEHLRLMYKEAEASFANDGTAPASAEAASASAEAEAAATSLGNESLAAKNRMLKMSEIVYAGKDGRAASALYNKLDNIHGMMNDSDTEEESGMRNSLYQQIKDKLVAGGMPAEEVAFIHDAKTDAQKLALVSAVNSGAVRILLGSTEKMGTGMNAQKRMVALHHMDCPWRPADLEQREGRIVRKGNINKKVRLYNYITQGTSNTASFDTYLWQIIRSKQGTIDQVMRADPSLRRADDIGDAVLHASQMISIGYNDPLMHERNELLAKVSKLERQRSIHEGDQHNARMRSKLLPKEILMHEKYLHQANTALALRDRNKPPVIGGKIADVVTTPGGQGYDDADAGMAVMMADAQMLPARGVKNVGTFNGFDVIARRDPDPDLQFGQGEVSFTLTPDADAHARHEAWGISKLGTNGENDSVRSYKDRFRRMLAELNDAVTDRGRSLDMAKTNLSAYQSSLGDFPKQQELTDLSDRLGVVDKQLGTNKNDVSQADTSMDDDDSDEGPSDREQMEKSVHNEYSGKFSRVGGKWSDTPFGIKTSRRDSLTSAALADSPSIGKRVSPSTGKRVSPSIGKRVSPSTGEVSPSIPGLSRALKGMGAEHRKEDAPRTDSTGTESTNHLITAQDSAGTATALANHLSSHGFDVADVRRGPDKYLRSFDARDGLRTDVLPSHNVIAVHRDTGKAHMFHIESRPWQGAGHGQGQGQAALAVSPSIGKRVSPSVGKLAAPKQSPEPPKQAVPAPPLEHDTEEGERVDAPDFAHSVAGQFGATLEEHQMENTADGSEHHAILLTHSNPSRTVDRIYKHLEGAGHPVSPVTYRQRTVDGHRKHVYTFTTRGADGHTYSFHVVRPRHENTGRVAKQYVPEAGAGARGFLYHPKQEIA